MVYDPQSFYTNFYNTSHDLSSYVNIVDATTLFSINCEIQGIETNALLDCGSGVTIMSLKAFNKIPKDKCPKLMQYTGHPLKICIGPPS